MTRLRVKDDTVIVDSNLARVLASVSLVSLGWVEVFR